MFSLGTLVFLVAGQFTGCTGVIREVLYDDKNIPAAYLVEMECKVKDQPDFRPIRWRRADYGEMKRRELGQ